MAFQQIAGEAGTSIRWEIRLARYEDASALAAIYAPYVEDTAVSFEYEAPGPEVFARRMREIAAQYPYLVCTANGTAVGYAYAHRQFARAAYQWNAELSVYVSPAYQHHGVGRALYGALLGLLVAQNVANAYANVVVPNPGSERLHLALGFRQLGVFRSTGFKCGAWRDVACFEKRLLSGDAPPAPFLPFAEIDTDAARRVLREQSGWLNDRNRKSDPA